MDLIKLYKERPDSFLKMTFDKKEAKKWGFRKIKIRSHYASITQIIKGLEKIQKENPKKNLKSIISRLKKLDEASLKFMRGKNKEGKANLNLLKRIIWTLRQIFSGHLSEKSRTVFYNKQLKKQEKESNDSEASSKASKSSEAKFSFKDSAGKESKPASKSGESAKSSSKESKSASKSLSGQTSSASSSEEVSLIEEYKPQPFIFDPLEEVLDPNNDKVREYQEKWNQQPQKTLSTLIAFLSNNVEALLHFDIIRAAEDIQQNSNKDSIYNSIFIQISNKSALKSLFCLIPAPLMKKYLLVSKNFKPSEFSPQVLKCFKINTPEEGVALLKKQNSAHSNKTNELIINNLSKVLFEQIIYLLAKEEAAKKPFSLPFYLPKLSENHCKWLFEMVEGSDDVFKFAFSCSKEPFAAEFETGALKKHVKRCVKLNFPQGLTQLTGEQLDTLSTKILEKKGFFSRIFQSWEEGKFISKDPKKIKWFLNRCLEEYNGHYPWNLSEEQIQLIPYGEIKWNQELFTEVFLKTSKNPKKEAGYQYFLREKKHYNFFVRKVFELEIANGLYQVVNDPNQNFKWVFEAVSKKYKGFYHEAFFRYHKQLDPKHPSKVEISNLFIQKSIEIGVEIQFTGIEKKKIDWVKFIENKDFFVNYFKLELWGIGANQELPSISQDPQKFVESCLRENEPFYINMYLKGDDYQKVEVDKLKFKDENQFIQACRYKFSDEEGELIKAVRYKKAYSWLVKQCLKFNKYNALKGFKDLPDTYLPKLITSKKKFEEFFYNYGFTHQYLRNEEIGWYIEKCKRWDLKDYLYKLSTDQCKNYDFKQETDKEVLEEIFLRSHDSFTPAVIEVKLFSDEEFLALARKAEELGSQKVINQLRFKSMQGKNRSQDTKNEFNKIYEKINKN